MTVLEKINIGHLNCLKGFSLSIWKCAEIIIIEYVYSHLIFHRFTIFDDLTGFFVENKRETMYLYIYFIKWFHNNKCSIGFS